MANVIITNDGQAKITNAILNNTSVFPKYFKVSSTDYALDPTLTDIDGWITKDINSWLVVDNNTVMITCVVEAYEATNECVTVGIYDIDNTLLFIGKPTTPYPAGTRQIITFDILLTNISQVLDFSYLPWNDSEVYLLLNQISTQNANEFTEVYQKITDLSVKVDQLRNDIDNLIVGGTVSNSVTLDGYPASQAADPNTVAVRDSSGALTIAPAGSADQAVTLQQADDRYVNVTGDTMINTLLFNITSSSPYKVIQILPDLILRMNETSDDSNDYFAITKNYTLDDKYITDGAGVRFTLNQHPSTFAEFAFSSVGTSGSTISEVSSHKFSTDRYEITYNGVTYTVSIGDNPSLSSSTGKITLDGAMYMPTTSTIETSFSSYTNSPRELITMLPYSRVKYGPTSVSYLFNDDGNGNPVDTAILTGKVNLSSEGVSYSIYSPIYNSYYRTATLNANRVEFDHGTKIGGIDYTYNNLVLVSEENPLWKQAFNSTVSYKILTTRDVGTVYYFNYTGESSVTFTAPLDFDYGKYLFLIHGTVEGGQTGVRQLIVNGTVLYDIYIGDYPDGSAPITFSCVLTFTSTANSYTISANLNAGSTTTYRWVIRAITVVRLT